MIGPAALVAVLLLPLSWTGAHAEWVPNGTGGVYDSGFAFQRISLMSIPHALSS